MKFWAVVLILSFVSAVLSQDKCRDDEYVPGPNCGLEPSCAARSSHSHPKHSCDCWCKPGTYRVQDTNECVILTDCH